MDKNTEHFSVAAWNLQGSDMRLLGITSGTLDVQRAIRNVLETRGKPLGMNLIRRIDAEGRARGRRQRQKARAEKELPTFDLDSECRQKRQSG